MKKLIAFSIAIIIHIAILFAGNAIYKPAEIYLQQGQSSIEMYLIPSIESQNSKEELKKKEIQNELEYQLEQADQNEIVEKTQLLTEDLSSEENLEEEESDESDEVEAEQVKEAEDDCKLKKTTNKPDSILKTPNQIINEESKKSEDAIKNEPIVKKLAKITKEKTTKKDFLKEKLTKEIEKPEEKIPKEPEKLGRERPAKEIDLSETVPLSEEKSRSDSNSTPSTEIVGDILTKGITAPTIEGVSKPRYPLSCRKKGHEGVCVLEAAIDSKGNCTKISILQSAGCKKLDKSAIKALKRARFSPSKNLGINISSTKKVAFRFKIEDID